jgi:hypothetical protein
MKYRDNEHKDACAAARTLYLQGRIGAHEYERRMRNAHRSARLRDNARSVQHWHDDAREYRI